jgi:hypothetical protein
MKVHNVMGSNLIDSIEVTNLIGNNCCLPFGKSREGGNPSSAGKVPMS